MTSAEEACRRLMTRTALLIDFSEPEGFAQLFDEQARMESRGATHVGRDAIRDLIRSRDPQRRTRHVLGAVGIEVDGTSARGIAYYTVYESRDSGDLPVTGHPVSVGEFHQEYRRNEEGWQIIMHRSERVFRLEVRS